MKAFVCDPCLVAGKLTPTDRYWRSRTNGLKLYVCYAEHSDWAKDKTPDEWLKLLLEAEGALFRLSRAGAPERKRKGPRPPSFGGLATLLEG